MANLYELTNDYYDLMREYEFSEDDQRAEVLQRIYGLQDTISDKAEAYARIIRNLKADAEAYKAEAQRLTAKQRAAESAIDGLKSRLLDAMNAIGADEIKTTIGKWRVQMNPASCQVIDDSAVPAEYHIPQPDKIDRNSILKHFKTTGELLPGVEITQTAGIRFR